MTYNPPPNVSTFAISRPDLDHKLTFEAQIGRLDRSDECLSA